MKKLNFNFKFTDLEGKELDAISVKENMANILWLGNTANPVKFIEIARKIYTDGEIELSSEDIELVRKAIVSSNTVYDWVKEQLIKSIDK